MSAKSKRTVLITGASRGIGRELARCFSERGDHVVLAARDEPALQETCSEIEQVGGQATVLPLDVSACDDCVRRIRTFDDTCGGIDVVIANAGVGALPAHSRLSWESMSDALHTNFCGAAATLTAILPKMVERRRGHLVGISSLASYGALPRSSAYCAPKAGLSMLLDCLRLDARAAHVAVTEVKLGFVRTAAVRDAQHDLPLLMEPAEVARILSRRLETRPERIVLPRSLGAVARIGAHLPRSVRALLFRVGGAG